MRAVLLDSGGVLIGPVGGRWNPRFDFEPTVRRRAPWLSAERLRAAIAVGDRFLAGSSSASRDDYHRSMLEALGVRATADLLAELDAPVEPTQVVEPYPEVIDVLDALVERGIRLAVVSDNWPNLPELHRGVGLGGYFDVYAISAAVGRTKPDPAMYHHASDALGLGPSACLFVDDDPRLVEAAIELGYQGCAVVRSAEPVSGVPTVPDLRGILTLLDAP